jgi:hypothetical protein
MAKQQSQQHRLSKILTVAIDNNWDLNHGRFFSRFRWRVLSKHFLDVGLPICYVLHHRRAFRVHHLCLCCHR